MAESGMQSALIVSLVDEMWKVLDDIFESFVRHGIDSLYLHGLHEALRLSVVVRIAAPAHRADQAVSGQHVAVALGGILRAAVRVMHATGSRFSALDRSL